MEKTSDDTLPSMDIPTIEIDAASPSVYTMKSKSFEIPRSHAHFDTLATASRPELESQQQQQQQRPTMYSHRSLTQSVSSVSLYSHFAGERFSPKHSSHDVRSKEIKRDNKADDSSETATSFSDEEQQQEPKASVTKAMFMFLKAFIGSGVLFLPKAFQNGGIVLSPILMIIVAVICQVAFLRLVKTQSVIGGSYGDMGGVLFGPIVRYIVLFFLVISQMGFVCSYFIFISGNLVIIVDVLSHCATQIAQKYYIWISFVAIGPLVLIRYIAKLSFAAVIADLFIVFGLISCLYFTSKELHEFGVGPDVKPINSAFALMIGTATFAFEGIGLVLPIGESMKKPEKFPFVMTVGMIIVCTVYILIGGISYLAYGNRIQPAVVYNFPRDNPLTVTVHILYTAAIILSAPLVLFPATKILENGLFKKYPSGSGDLRIKWIKNVFRIFLLAICAIVAFSIGGDNLDIFVSLVGSIACVPLCFIFPGLFHYKVSKSMKGKAVDVFLIVFGSIIMVYTFYVTVNSLITPQVESFTLPPYCPAHT